MIIRHGHAYFLPRFEPPRRRGHDDAGWFKRVIFREKNFAQVFSFVVSGVFRSVDEEVPIENIGGGGRFGNDAGFGRFEEEFEFFLEAESGGHCSVDMFVRVCACCAVFQ